MALIPGTRRRPIRSLPFNVIIPNVLTLFALSSGVTAIRFGIEERWERAVIALILAAILDGLDGRIARLLRGTSKFGAELDSLSDIICFGVAPAIILHQFAMHGSAGFGWALCLCYAVCCALRLARFNTMIGETDQPAWAYNYFTGVPAPAAALVVSIPLILSNEFEHSIFSHASVVGAFLVGASLLMVSRIPTFSFKKGRIPVRGVLPLLLLIGVLAAFLVTQPWITLAGLGLIYLGSIPVSIVAYRRRAAAEAAGVMEEEDDDFDVGL
ncbi:MAG: CDP-diacylglycerol--serine O-phosphatidyltransferase [Rhodospirillaceae bacterium]|nr:CDP-diacylglycerol--serine O-phosphatidyltransferase [Rhodospirillaceae bacterium]